MYSNMSSYGNYSSIPMSYNPRMSSSSMSSSMMPMSSSSDRLVGGGFLGPFLLGGITGGLLAPAFYPRPYYYSTPYYYPYPYYGSYYR